MKAIRLIFIILDKNDKILINKNVTFPFEIEAEKIDKEIAEIFLLIIDERKKNASIN